MPYSSAESHVFVFTQLLRSRARKGEATRVLFVDLYKAYNRVHLPSLWHLLREMGVPDLIVRILDDWAAKRRTRLRVNGELSEWYSMLAGTPQGDPLSCLLFNCYIEPLIRYINSLASIRGISIAGIERVVKALFFADDLAGFSAADADDSQAIMDAVMRWCRDWFMEASTGAGKTETVTYRPNPLQPGPPGHAVFAAVPPDTGPDEDHNILPWGPWKVSAAIAADVKGLTDPVPPASAAPRAISDSLGYRYLGWRSWFDISDNLATSHLIKTMDQLYYRYFTFNLTIRRCSPTLQLQLLHCNVNRPIIYLLSMLAVSSVVQDKFDRRMRRYGRHIFKLARGTPCSVVTAVTRINPFRALQGRERARLCLQLNCPIMPNEAIAFAVFKSVLTEGSGRRLAHANLPVRHFRALEKLRLLGIAPPSTSPLHNQITTEAGLHGDRIAMHQWQHEGRLASAIRDPPHASRVRRNATTPSIQTLRLPRPLPLDHVSDLYFGFNQPIGLGPVKHGLAPLSYLGPSGTSIAALSNHQCNVVSIVAQLHTGNQALRRFPWRPRYSVRPTSLKQRTGTGIPGDDEEFSDTDTEASSSSEDESGQASDTTAGSTSTNEDEDNSTDSDSKSTSSAEEHDRNPNLNSSHPSSYRARSGRRRTTPSGRQDLVRRRPPNARLEPPSEVEFRSSAQVCRFCGLGQEHPSHAFFECSAARLVTLRAALLVDAAVTWGRLLTKMEEAYMGTYQDLLPDVDETRAEVASAYSDTSDPSEAMWLTYRLLWAIPWSARDVPPSARAAARLGASFDDAVLSRHASRPLADSWVAWASKWTRRFGEAWTDLLVATGGRTLPSAVAARSDLRLTPSPSERITSDDDDSDNTSPASASTVYGLLADDASSITTSC